MIKLSVLDQSPVRDGITASQALQESVELAKLTDRLGYTRYWVSEHHNTRGLAGAAPEVFIARLASVTEHMRIGSGGVMLPNHSSLKVAENFRTLEGLFPGRIDLGMGRAPGGDRLTSALLNPSNNFSEQDFINQLVELQAFLTDDREPGTVHEKVKAIPMVETVPELWLLTSSGQSAVFAAHFGMGLSFAQFISPAGGPEAVKMYRERFQPSELLQKPQASVGIFVFCAETEEKAEEMKAVMNHRLLSLAKGLRNQQFTYAQVKDLQYTAQEKAIIEHNSGRMIAGDQKTVKASLEQLCEDYGVDEVVVATITEKHEDRMRSYELLADSFLS